jgi:hypothetical protein
MMRWMKRPGLTGKMRGRSQMQALTKLRRYAVPAAYLGLHKYLDDRYANTVVLTFAEIEDLLGFTLPDLARLQQDWWANADPDGIPSDQSRSWTQASRTATPNLLAQIVVFERGSPELDADTQENLKSKANA